MINTHFKGSTVYEIIHYEIIIINNKITEILIDIDILVYINKV